ncbi:hypothetical protein WMY93_013134 [Mugilogobius chulae]|uniref:Ig-like domain-containing protein n=1 Tax=Mugilogobius chulae TaxID=88201 RepID=A0AAW0P0S7_9GOBI
MSQSRGFQWSCGRGKHEYIGERFRAPVSLNLVTLECSQSCGGGLQFRKVFCKQLLSSGAYRTLRDGACGPDPPNSTRTCANSDCAPFISGGDWGKCSVSCGLGVQRREPQCQQLSTSNRLLTLSWDKCSGLSSPPLIRTCRMMTCPKLKKAMQPLDPLRYPVRNQLKQVKRPPEPYNPFVKQCPFLQSRHAIYIQTQKVNRLQLTIGGTEEAISSARGISFTKSGSLKIQYLGAEHVGVYKCVAGPASNIFTLTPAPSPTPLSWDDFAVSCQTHSSSLLHWASVPVELLPSGVQEMSLQPQLEERLINITVQADLDKGGQEHAARHAAELIASMLTDMAPSQVWRRTAEKGQADDSSSNWSEASTVEVVPGKPVIVRQQQKLSWSLQKNLNISIGQNGLLTNSTRSIIILCPAQGVPSPKVVWSKDGNLLQRNNRVWWDSEGLHILQPRASDQGQYKCICSNVHGSDSDTSLLRVAEPPSISIFWRNITDPGVVLGQSIRATVGATVSVHQGANLTLDCPTSGVPQPTVTWQRRGRPLPPSALLLSSGSLWIRNVSLSDLGTYSCLANNPIGKSIASTVLHVHNQKPEQVPVYPVSESRTALSQELNRRRLLMASSRGTSVFISPGEVLRIGCPVVPHHTMPVRWYFNNQSLEEEAYLSPAAAPQVRVLAGGRALEVSTAQVQFSGRYQCETLLSSSRQPLTAWIYVHSQEYGWRLGEWTACSSSCGNRGSHVRRVRCVSVLGKDVPPTMCKLRPKPLSGPVPCNTQDCPPSHAHTSSVDNDNVLKARKYWSKSKRDQTKSRPKSKRDKTKSRPSQKETRPSHVPSQRETRPSQSQVKERQDQVTSKSKRDKSKETSPSQGPSQRETSPSQVPSPSQVQVKERQVQVKSQVKERQVQVKSERQVQVKSKRDKSKSSPSQRKTSPSQASSQETDQVKLQSRDKTKWAVSEWSKCSSSCGEGLQRRQVVCQQLDAQGTTRTLSNQACEGTSRPEHNQNCTVNNCPVWVTSPWGKCSGRCLSPSSTVQKRSVQCQRQNGTTHSGCDQSSR